MNRRFLHFFLGLFFLLPMVCGFSQSKFDFEKLELGKTDIQSIVYAVAYDKNENLWLATEEGAFRYNSKDIFPYTTHNGIPEAFGNRIYTVYKDWKQQIWIGGENGIAQFDYQKNKFIACPNGSFSIEHVKKIENADDNSIVFCSSNGIWECQNGTVKPLVKNQNINSFVCMDKQIVYLTNEGVFVYDRNLHHAKKIDFSTYKTAVINGSTIKILEHHVFIGTKNGELYQTEPTFSFLKKINFPPVLTGNAIRDIEYKNNTYFVAFDGGGVVMLNKEGQFLGQYKFDENNPNSISSNGVYDIFFGSDGVDWFATYGGGVCFSTKNKASFKVYTHQINTSNSLSNNMCRAILEEGTKIWFGTKKGLSIYDKSSNVWKHLSSFPGSSPNADNIILSLCLQGDYVWAGTYNQGVYKINRHTYAIESYATKAPATHQIFVDKVYKVFKDSRDNIWIGGIDGALSVVFKDQTIKKINLTDIRAITETPEGKILVGGKKGVFSIHPQTHEISYLEDLKPTIGKLNYSTINALSALPNGLVLGTNGDGVVFYNWKTRKIHKLNGIHRLPSSIIQGVIPISEHNFWISTTKGISNIQMVKGDTLVKNYTKTDGLSSNEFNYGAYYINSDSTLYFGGIHGVTAFKPSQLKPRKIYPKIVLEALKIDNQEVPTGGEVLPAFINETPEIYLGYNQNSFGLTFSGVLHSYTSKIQYSWMLEGFEENWSPLSSSNEINYTNISPGSYVLKIKATNELGEFGPIKTLKIHIASPWYATIWAYLFYLLVIAGILYGLVYVTKILEVKKSKEDQINFFNNLTHEIKTPLAILLSSLEENQENNEENKSRLKTTIERINSLINQILSFQRYNVYGEMNVSVTKIKLVEYIKKLIEEFKPLLDQKKLEIEIEDQFTTEILYFDEDQLNKILFNLISNAIKYSFENSKIIIGLSLDAQQNLELRVQDFGIGIPKNEQSQILSKFFRAKNAMNRSIAGTGLGLMIVKSIVDATGGKMRLESEENQGTTFFVTLKNLHELYLESTITPQETEVLEGIQEHSKYAQNKILIVEDNLELRRYLKNVLENHFLVYEASNGQEGIELALHLFPDLIITDFMMPVMDGMDFCLKIKEDINLNHIPVFMMTALHNSTHKKESFENGITEYIEKPINISILLAKINNIFTWQEKLRERYIHQGASDIAEKNKNQKENEFILRLEAIVLDKIKDEDFSLQDICNIIGMSRTSLYMKLKNLIDLSPQDFIIHTKLKHAKKLLLEGDVNIKEVAYSCGFSNPKYFSTSFKKVFGMTPSAFVKSLEK